MKTPESLVPAMDSGIIQEVVRPLMSGKEAQIYIVIAGGVECAAKVYKEASQRTFKHRAEYTEGRRSKNSRDQRAVSKRSRHGRKQDEDNWRNTEVDMIYRLRDAGVRVPEPINFVEGVLVMELVKNAEGDPAPRLGDLRFEPEEARAIYHWLLREVVRMLCAGVIHGDLSDFNVLMGAQGPVVIDFPQAIDAVSNQGARKFLLRDVQNLHRFVERYAPEEPTHAYAEEMWALYELNRLEPDTELRGNYRDSEKKADTGEVLALIEDAARVERDRRIERGDEPEDVTPKPRRVVVDFTNETRPASRGGRPPDRNGRPRSDGDRGRRDETAGRPGSPAGGRGAPAKEGEASARRRRNRRGSGGSSGGGEASGKPTLARPARTQAAEPTSRGEGASSDARPRPRRRSRRSADRNNERPVRPDSAPSEKRPARSEGEERPRSSSTTSGDDANKPVGRKRRRRPRRRPTEGE